MKVLSQATVVLNTPTEKQMFVRIISAIDVPPCLQCGENTEAMMVSVGVDTPIPEDEYYAIIYPCGHVRGNHHSVQNEIQKIPSNQHLEINPATPSIF